MHVPSPFKPPAKWPKERKFKTGNFNICHTPPCREGNELTPNHSQNMHLIINRQFQQTKLDKFITDLKWE